MPGVALELAVGGSSFLKHSKGRHSVVRLPEDAQTEHADRDDQHGSSQEGDEQLGVDLRRDAANRSDYGIVADAQPPLLGGGGTSFALSMSVINHLPSIRATS